MSALCPKGAKAAAGVCATVASKLPGEMAGCVPSAGWVARAAEFFCGPAGASVVVRAPSILATADSLTRAEEKPTFESPAMGVSSTFEPTAAGWSAVSAKPYRLVSTFLWRAERFPPDAASVSTMVTSAFGAVAGCRSAAPADPFRLISGVAVFLCPSVRSTWSVAEACSPSGALSAWLPGASIGRPDDCFSVAVFRRDAKRLSCPAGADAGAAGGPAGIISTGTQETCMRIIGYPRLGKRLSVWPPFPVPYC